MINKKIKKQHEKVHNLIKSFHKRIFSIASGLSNDNRPFDVNFRSDVEELAEIKGFCSFYSVALLDQNTNEGLDLNAKLDEVYDEAHHVQVILWDKWNKLYREERNEND